MSINLNTIPYHNDYASTDGFLKVLFKPGYAIQGRELIEIQSILQNQISSLSDHLFKDGSIVIPGQSSVDTNVDYIKIRSTAGGNSTYNSVDDFLGRILIKTPTIYGEGDDGIMAKVIHVESGIDGDNRYYDTLFLKYIAGSTLINNGKCLNTNTNTESLSEVGDIPLYPTEGQCQAQIDHTWQPLDVEFVNEYKPGSILDTSPQYILDPSGIETAVLKSNFQCEVLDISVGFPTGKSSLAHIDAGIYYVGGNMVGVHAQTISLDWYSNRPTYKVGLRVIEEIVSVYEDSSLYDNAQGSPNFNAPGADRYKVSLLLEKIEYDSPVSNDFIQLISINDGQIERILSRTDYALISEIMALRTYEQSGNFTIKSFSLDVRNYFDEFDNNGIKTINDIAFRTFMSVNDFISMHFKHTDLYDDVNEVGHYHHVTVRDVEKYPEQNLIVSSEIFYPGKSHDKMMSVFRNHLAIGIENGIAYVKGNRISSSTTVFIPYKRSTDTIQRNSAYLSYKAGKYLYVSDINGLPEINSTVNLFSTMISERTSMFSIRKHTDNLGAAGGGLITISNMLTNDETSFVDGNLYNWKDVENPSRNDTEYDPLSDNPYKVDIVGTAKIQSVEFVQGTQPNIINTGLSSINANISTPNGEEEESGIFKIYIYDLKFNNMYNTPTKYTASHIRSIGGSNTTVGLRGTANTTGGVWSFCGNVLHQYKLSSTGVGSNIVKSGIVKPLIFLAHQDNTKTRGMVYNQVGETILVKHIGSSTYFDGTTVSSDVFKSGGHVRSVEWSNTASGTFDAGGNPNLIETQNGGRISSATVINNDGGGSMAEFETPYIQTVRHVDDISGTITIDTSYTYQQTFINQQSRVQDEGGSNELKLVLPITSFDRFMSFDASGVIVYKVGSETGVGKCFPIESDGYIVNQDFTELKLRSSVTIETNVDYNIIITLIKTEAIEKIKSKIRDNVYLPYTLVDKSGIDTNSPTTYDRSWLPNDLTGVIGTTFGLDVYEDITNSQYLIDNKLTDSSGAIVTMSSVQLKHSDVIKIRVYDLSVDASGGDILETNLYFRIDLDGNVLFINEMTNVHLKFAADAWSFYERQGIAPWDEPLYSTNKTDNPFFDEMTRRYNINFAIDPTDPYDWGRGDSHADGTPVGVPIKNIYDVTDNYELDDGQRNGLYDISVINLKRGRNPVIGRMAVVYDYYEHGSGDYATVDSYRNTLYEDIPKYKSIRLSGYMDFRPSSIYTNIHNSILGRGDVFRSNTFSVRYPLSGTSIITDYRLYLKRKDRIFLSGDGMFNIQYGNASLNPILPSSFIDGMLLYNVEATEYTSTPRDVLYSAVDNQLYKMDDMRKLETRISKLEYYTSLSLLEKETTDMIITDSNGNNKFKNGFLVEPFLGHNIGDVTDPDYQCAIDYESGILRPKFSEKNVNLLFDNDNSSHYTIEDGLVMMPYEEELVITQPKCSKHVNVNPYAVFTFRGDVLLNPPNDNWRDVERLPDLTINRDEYDNFKENAEQLDLLGTKWGEITDSWISGQSSSWSSSSVLMRGRGIRRITTSTEIQSTSITSRQVGVINTLKEDIKTERLGDRELNTTIIPYIRSRVVIFRGTALKPNTRVFAFFDGRNVTKYCSLVNSIIMTNIATRYSSTTSFVDDIDIRSAVKNDVQLFLQGARSSKRMRLIDILYKSETEVEIIVLDNINPDIIYENGEDLLMVSLSQNTSSVIGTYSYVKSQTTKLITDNKGNIDGLFEIPNTEVIRFRCGERDFRLTDQQNNSTDSGTSAEVTYSATGMLVNVQDTVIQTRSAKIVQTNTSRNTTVTNDVFTGRTNTSDTGWYDPLAQTIEVKPDNGMFITSVDLFFASKPADSAPQIPVKLQIRDTVAGFPGQIILGNQVQVESNHVNVDADKGEIPTNFKFDYPIFLKNGKEYCIVILADTQDYTCWISRLGEESLDGAGKISKQPYAGVFFKSQNASTWTADQMEDLKFNVYRAKFDITAPSRLSFKNTHTDINGYLNNTVVLRENSVTITPHSSLVTFYVKNHNLVSEVYSTRNLVAITGVRESSRYGGDADNNSIKGEYFNGVHSVISTTIDSFTIDVSKDRYKWYHPDDVSISDSIRSTLIAGTTKKPINGGRFTLQGVSSYNLPRVYVNTMYDIIYPSVTNLLFNGTDISYLLKTTSGTSQHSTNLPGIIDFNWNSIMVDGGGFGHESTRSVFSYENEYFFGNQPSLQFSANLSSTDEHLSPIIDLKRFSAIMHSNRINYPEWNIDENTLEEIPVEDSSWRYVANGAFVSELEPGGASCDCRYITKEVVLEDPATSLRIMISVYKPPGSEISVYYKTKSTDSSSYRHLRYVNVPQLADFDKMVSVSEDEWFEFEYDVSDILEFTSFGIKLVLRADNSSYVPMVRDLRVIATS